MAQMWPNVREGDQRPDCRSNGPHRFGSLHFLPVDKSIMIRVCRLCSSEKITKFKIIDGEIQENAFITSTQPKQVDKSTIDSDVKPA